MPILTLLHSLFKLFFVDINITYLQPTKQKLSYNQIVSVYPTATKYVYYTNKIKEIRSAGINF